MSSRGTTFDSFAEPYTRQADESSLDEVRAHIRALEQQHKQNSIPLSGRIIHVVHDLPVVATLKPCDAVTVNGLPSPPATPPSKSMATEYIPKEVIGDVTDDSNSISTAPSTDTPPSPTDTLSTTATSFPPTSVTKAVWSLAPRYGHSAMISGIRSLSTTHEQIIIGWTGDIQVTPGPGPVEKISVDDISREDRMEYEDVLRNWTPKESDPDDEKKTTYVPVWLDDKVAHGHYDGYCKQILWPLFHYLLWQDVATEYDSADQHYPHYESANAAFSQRIAEVYQPGDLIWVHDYHLLLVPRLVRESIPDAALGLFVHTPFPSSEVFRCLPRRREILDGMLGANLVCFQTYSYSRHFISTCIRVCGYETNSRGIDVEGHVTTVSHCPVGIDAERVARDTERPGIQPKLEALRTLYEGKKIIVGRDKLDVVKGVIQKLCAFEKLFQDYPEWIGNVVLIQVTSPSLTDSPKLERQVSELVSHINGEYGSLDFIPVHHYHQTLKKDEFYALLSVADLAVITPLRDGMNTTSMEFVIAQGKSNRSPSVLSEFMGISKNMEDALLVNPWNLGEVAAAINKGLLMSPAEKAARHAKLYKVVTTHTSHSWASILVKQLLGQVGKQGMARQTPYIPRDQLRSSYASAKKRLFLFDYDGTLAPIVKIPSMAVPSMAALEALEKLSNDPKNVVYIISGRDQAFLDLHLGHLKNIGFSAEHGGFVKEAGSGEWNNFTANLDMSWIPEVEEIFRYYTERTQGSHVEMKKSSITWHYRSSDPEWGQFQCRQCQDLLENNLAKKRPIEVMVGKKNLEVRPIAVNKGEIVKRILYLNPDTEFIFCAGDDKTDEDMFRALSLFQPDQMNAPFAAPLSVTLIDNKGAQPVDLSVKADAIFTTAVGHRSKKTLASWHVTTPQEVVEHMLDLVKAPGMVRLNGAVGGFEENAKL